jgi:predicted transposase/invertase (TIGR01784 family)
MNADKPLISFDYAIKYLLKDKGDFGIVEGFISALLKTKGYGDVKIISLLETESNKDDPKDKRSIADLIVEDIHHNKYIIEIERNVKDSFIHKACFNTSRLIVDNLAQREDYTHIVKVFHISLLYFKINTGQGTRDDTSAGTIYHGKTIIHEIETNERLSVHLKNVDTNEVFDATDILPEYFFISVPNFNDRLINEIDDWLYVMKHDNVPKTFHSPYMIQVSEKLSILKMSKDERADYTYYMKKLYNDRDELQAAESRGLAQGLAQGMEKGLAEGEAKRSRDVELKMLAKKKDDDEIVEFSGLTSEELAALKKSIEG